MSTLPGIIDLSSVGSGGSCDRDDCDCDCYDCVEVCDDREDSPTEREGE